MGDITNYEKLILNIETNGTVTPGEAIKQTTQIIMDHFSVIAGAANEMILEMPLSVVSEKSAAAKPKKAKKAAKKKA